MSQPLSPATQAVMAAIKGETSPQIAAAQALRAVAFLRLTKINHALLIEVAQDLDP